MNMQGIAPTAPNRHSGSEISRGPNWRETAEYETFSVQTVLTKSILADACYNFYKYREAKTRYIKTTQDQDKDQAYFTANPKSKAVSDYGVQKSREICDRTKREWFDSREICSGALNSFANEIRNSMRDEFRRMLKEEVSSGWGKEDISHINEEVKMLRNDSSLLYTRTDILRNLVDGHSHDQSRLQNIEREQSKLSQRIQEVERQIQIPTQMDVISYTINSLTPIIDEQASAITELQDTTTAYHTEIGTLPPGERPEGRETILYTLRKTQQLLNDLNGRLHAPETSLASQIKTMSTSLEELFVSLQNTSGTSDQVSALTHDLNRLKLWIESRDTELDSYIDDVQKAMRVDMAKATQVPPPFVNVRSAIQEIVQRIEALNIGITGLPERHKHDMMHLEAQIRHDIEQKTAAPPGGLQTSSDLKTLVGPFGDFDRRLRGAHDLGKMREEVSGMRENLENLAETVIKYEPGLIRLCEQAPKVKDETSH
ncbi:hypothetical protein NEOLI_005300 [Neolecta irregularis DAH-3]|uniref:Uncharacterized protein n=1 Tax=Neolecta irregularis (strain DAH-3) TaxID=1198029 RepID=A0A1U7LT40_NEOID|nr:hypothetical protein NEOLI_005300 [Neolecta irregularis DAH-3]|eukprot:OLL25681.1 hypothetical protein NEOLI_005300 [Neolecta irregularis DAH-3]